MPQKSISTLRDVFIRELSPRELSTFNSSFYEGIQPYLWFGYFLMAGGLFFLIIAILKIRMVYPFILIFIVLLLGYLSVNKAVKTANLRKQAFLYGQVVFATVTNHGRQFSLFKSERDYSVTVNFKDQSGKQHSKILVHKSKNLWNSNPKGSRVIGIEHNDFFFFGEEMGCNFKFFNK